MWKNKEIDDILIKAIFIDLLIIIIIKIIKRDLNE